LSGEKCPIEGKCQEEFSWENVEGKCPLGNVVDTEQTREDEQ